MILHLNCVLLHVTITIVPQKWMVIFLLETIKVYDGYSSLRKRFFRTVTVNKNCSKDELLLAAMRAFVATQVKVYRLVLVQISVSFR